MAGELDVQKFTAAVVSVIVVVIIGVTVLIPIISENQATGANAGSINAMINIIPLLIFVGVIIAIVAMFLGKRKE